METETPPLGPGNDKESCEYFTRRWSRRLSALGEACSAAPEHPREASPVLSLSKQDEAEDVPEDAVSNHERLLVKQLHQVTEQELLLQLQEEDAISCTRRWSKWCETNNKNEDAGDSPPKTEEQMDKLQLSGQDFCSYLTRRQRTKVLDASKRLSRVMDLEINPPVFQDSSFGSIELLRVPPRTSEPLIPSSPCKRPRSHVLDLQGPDRSTQVPRWLRMPNDTDEVASKRPRVAALSENVDNAINTNETCDTNGVASKRPRSTARKLHVAPTSHLSKNVDNRSEASEAAAEAPSRMQDASAETTTNGLQVERASIEGTSRRVPSGRTAKQASKTATEMMLQDGPHTPFRHVLLGNANDDFETNDLTQVLEHPQYCPDTQTDGVMSSTEIEYAWLCEESLHCCGGTRIEWSFVYKHASRALKAKLRDGTDLVREQVAEATAQKRKHVRLQLQRGYRRPNMKTSIAFHRLALRRKVSVESLTQKKRLPPTAGSTISTKKPTAKLPVKKPARKQPGALQKVPESILTKNEEEIAWLLEESMIQNAANGFDHEYILANASPTLHAAMERHVRRWLPRLVRLTDMKVNIEFERKRTEIQNLLYSGYRRPETKNVLPTGFVSASQFKESQSRRD